MALPPVPVSSTWSLCIFLALVLWSIYIEHSIETYRAVRMEPAAAVAATSALAAAASVATTSESTTDKPVTAAEPTAAEPTSPFPSASHKVRRCRLTLSSPR